MPPLDPRQTETMAATIGRVARSLEKHFEFGPAEMAGIAAQYAAAQAALDALAAGLDAYRKRKDAA